jgi:ABC-type lipoprotein release transport system permease subunit
MRTLIKLAWRNIWRNKRRSLISIASVLFAVLFAISAESLERGSYELQIENMVMFSTGYVQIQDVLYEEEPSMDNMMLYDETVTDAIASLGEEISYTVPRIQGFALAATDHKTRGVMMMGIDPESEHRFNELSDQIVRGEYLSAGDEAVMLSEGLAKILSLDVGDTLVAIGQGFQGVNASGMYPVKGIVKLVLPEMNNNTVYLPLTAAQWFFGADDRVTSVIVMPQQPKNSERVAASLQQKLDPEWYTTLTWKEMLSDFLRMMQLDTAGNKVIIMILYVVIGFGLFGTILTMMMERMREFAMMIAIGMKRRQLALVCLMESIFLSFIGVVAGMAITFPIVFYFNRNPIPLQGEMADMMADYGFSAVIPTSVAPTIFITQAIVIFFIALLIGLYPVVKTMKMDVVQHAK